MRETLGQFREYFKCLFNRKEVCDRSPGNVNLLAAATVIFRLHTFGEMRMNPIWVATLGVAVIALTGAVVTAASFRSRNAKQWRSSLDAYAEREIAQQRRKQKVQRAQAFFTLVGTTVVDSPREPWTATK
jgi:hypothetical protein